MRGTAIAFACGLCLVVVGRFPPAPREAEPAGLAERAERARDEPRDTLAPPLSASENGAPRREASAAGAEAVRSARAEESSRALFGTIEVRVVDALGAPAGEVRVRATFHGETGEGRPLGRDVGETDAHGRVVLSVPAGTATITAWSGSRAFGEGTLRVPAGQGVSLEVRTAELVSISGIVRDAASGAPVAGARVTSRVSEAIGRPPATTDDSGCFELPWWRVGCAETLDVDAEGFGHASLCLLVDTQGRWACLGEAADLQMQASLPFVEVALVPSAVLTGRLVGPAGRPVEGARVRAAGEFSPTYFLVVDDAAETLTGPEGHFELKGLRSDVGHLVVCEGSGVGAGLRWAPAGPRAQDLGTIRLAPYAGVEGLARDPAGRALAGAEVALAIVPGGEVAGQLPADALPALRAESRVAPDGSFAIGGLVPGRGVISIRLGGDEVARAEVALAEGEVCRVPAIESRAEVVVLEATLLAGDDEPLREAAVSVLSHGSPFALVSTDEEGRLRVALPREELEAELGLRVLDDRGAVVAALEGTLSSLTGRLRLEQ